MLQLAIRSGTREEFQELKTEKRLIPFKTGDKAQDLYEVLKPYKGYPLYITMDLDWFDPSILPGTGSPEPGGFFWQDFASIIEVLKIHNLVAADIVELSPQIDISGNSNIFAAKVTRSLLMLLTITK